MIKMIRCAYLGLSIIFMPYVSGSLELPPGTDQPAAAAAASSAAGAGEAGAGDASHAVAYDYRSLYAEHFPHFLRSDGNIYQSARCTLSPENIAKLPMSDEAIEALYSGAECYLTIIPRGVYQPDDGDAPPETSVRARRLVRRVAKGDHLLQSKYNIPPRACLMRTGFHIMVSVNDSTQSIAYCYLGTVGCRFMNHSPMHFGDTLFPIIEMWLEFKDKWMNKGFEKHILSLLINHYNACKTSTEKYAFLYPAHTMIDLHEELSRRSDEQPTEIDLFAVTQKFDALTMEGRDSDPAVSLDCLVCDTRIPLWGLGFRCALNHDDLLHLLRNQGFTVQRPDFAPCEKGYGSVLVLLPEERDCLMEYYSPEALSAAADRNRIHTSDCCSVIDRARKREKLLIVDESVDLELTAEGESNHPDKWTFDEENPHDNAVASKLSTMFSSDISAEYHASVAAWEMALRQEAAGTDSTGTDSTETDAS